MAVNNPDRSDGDKWRGSNAVAMRSINSLKNADSYGSPVAENNSGPDASRKVRCRVICTVRRISLWPSSQVSKNARRACLMLRQDSSSRRETLGS